MDGSNNVIDFVKAKERKLEDARVYEYKTGPYQGVELDKVFLND